MFKPTVICKLLATDSSRNPRRSSTRLRPALMALEERRLMSGIVIIVDNPTDHRVDGQIDLREAIDKANKEAGPTTIAFSPVFDTPDKPQTITLTTGQLLVTAKDLTINGPASGLTVHGNGKSRILAVEPGAKAVISNLTITGGLATHDLGGGGVYNRGDLTLLNCNVTGNRAQYSVHRGYGGGVYNDAGSLTLQSCAVSNNTAGTRADPLELGGGLANRDGTVILENSSFTANVNTTEGGGVYNEGTAYVTNCTFDGNEAGTGGGLYNFGKASVVSCTFVNNKADTFGGGIYLRLSLEMWDTIVAGNTGVEKIGDHYLRDAADVYSLRLNKLDDEVVMKVHSGGNDNPEGGHNLIGNTNGSEGWGTTDLQNVFDPGLYPLAYNGGPTQTVALRINSPAINKGIKVNYAGTNTPLLTDQRGFRLDTPDPDIGAFQS
jgi:hypothetical protein